jgi:hypothetical protein
VTSGLFTFKFDANEDLGMITPSWDTTYSVRQGWTSFHLHLLPQHQNSGVLSSYVDGLHATLLLFLRKLEKITITLRLTGQAVSHSVFSKERTGSQEVTLTKTANGVFTKTNFLVQ